MDEHFELLEHHLESKGDTIGLIKLRWLKRSVFEAMKKHADNYDELLTILNELKKTETQNDS